MAREEGWVGLDEVENNDMRIAEMIKIGGRGSRMIDEGGEKEKSTKFCFYTCRNKYYLLTRCFQLICFDLV